jgi:hypothetical protein
MTNNQCLSHDAIILQERVRQAKWGFNVSVGFVLTNLGITTIGIALLMTGRIDQGAYMTLGGLSSTLAGRRCLQLSRDANDRLDCIQREKNLEE